MTEEEIIESLGSQACPNCGGYKRPRMSFCGQCYRMLPYGLKQALYRRVGQGYEEAFREATEFHEQRRAANAGTV